MLPTTDSNALDDFSDDEGASPGSALSKPPPSSTRLRQMSPSTSSYSTPTLSTRTRTTSDPFIDPSRSHGSALGFNPSPSDLTNHSDPMEASASTPLSASTSSYTARGRPHARQQNLDFKNSISTSGQPQYRVWTFPYIITNPEIQQLIKLFPTFITKRAMSRFPVGPSASSSTANLSKSKSKANDTTPRELEEGVGFGSTREGELAPGEIKVGTGKMRLNMGGDAKRVDGWRGSFWERVCEWFRNIFR